MCVGFLVLPFLALTGARDLTIIVYLLVFKICQIKWKISYTYYLILSSQKPRSHMLFWWWWQWGQIMSSEVTRHSHLSPFVKCFHPALAPRGPEVAFCWCCIPMPTCSSSLIRVSALLPPPGKVGNVRKPFWQHVVPLCFGVSFIAPFLWFIPLATTLGIFSGSPEQCPHSPNLHPRCASVPFGRCLPLSL